jgi:hypothetical protein
VFQAITSDEDVHVLIYVEEALRGHAILNVYAPTPEQAEQIKDILVDHHARTIKYFGRWAITVIEEPRRGGSGVDGWWGCLHRPSPVKSCSFDSIFV